VDSALIRIKVTLLNCSINDIYPVLLTYLTAGGFPSIIDITPYALHLSPPEYEVKLLRTG
ncbi:hypothetical protein ACNEMQ_003761, partial [Escherichia coli]